jgi:hypothetical protein
VLNHRRRLPLAVAAGACLLLASGAAAAPEDTFTATSAPSHVRPSQPAATFIVKLTNTSPSLQADRATIPIPNGFEVDENSVEAPATQAGSCLASEWDPDVNDDRIRLDRPSDNRRLCPGATLTVVFEAATPATEGVFSWNPALRGEDDEEEDINFTLSGPAPTVVVDGTAPAVTVMQKPLDPSNSTSASFGFTVSEPATAACKLDGAAVAPCASAVDYAGLADGAHTFTVTATDQAGNTGQASYTWTIETRPPTAIVASGPPALSNSRSATFAFSADEPSSFACELDGGGFQPCTSPAHYAGLGDGAHTFAVRPADALGNTGAAASHGWTIDATAPETALGSRPRSGTTAVSATFTFSATEPATFECKLDAAAFTPCTSPRSYTGLSRRAHSFEVRAIDAAANVDPAAAVHRWTIAVPRRATTTSALLTPRAGARVTSPPLLVWRRVAGASYYNIQLYRGSVKVLSSWPTRTRLQLRARWTYLSRKRKLSPGVYRWYVWPGHGRASANRYGRLLGQSTFTVAPG